MRKTIEKQTVAEAVKAQPRSVHLTHELNIGVPMLRCVFDPAGEYLYGAGQGQSVWRAKIDDATTTELEGHQGWVFSLAIHPDGELLLSGGADGNLIWWTAGDEKPTLQRKVAAHNGWIRDVVFSLDGKLFATAGNDNRVKLWRTEDGKLLNEFVGHEYHVYRLAFHPEGDQLVSGDLTLRLKQWDLATGKQLRELHAPSLHRIDKNHNLHIGGTRGLSFSDDGRLLAVCGIREIPNSLGGEVRPGTVIFDFESGKIQQEQKTTDAVSAVAWNVAFHPDDFIVMVAGGKDGGHLLFWKKDEPEEFHAFELPDPARDMMLSPDRLQLATAHYDGHLRISSLLPDDQS